MTAPALFSGQSFVALGWALFHFLWQGALVAGLFGALQWLVRNRTPALRYALACGALATMLGLPVATVWSMAVRGERNPRPSVPAAVLSGGIFSVFPAATSDASDGGDPLIPATLRNRFEAQRPWALSAWFAGVLLLSVRFLGGFAAARRLTRRGTRPVPAVLEVSLARIASRLSIARPVRLLESTLVTVPTAIGAFRPVILFPATAFLGLPARGLEALIAHELAHVRRHDYLVNLLQTVAETLLFYHPAVWWVSARVRAEREECCDDLAIAATGDPRTYARALIRLEEMRGGGPPAPALAVAAGGGNLWKRVLRLLTQAPAVRERPSGWLAAAVPLAMLLVLGAAARVGPSGGWNGEAEGASRASIDTSAPDVVVCPPAQPTELDPTTGEGPADTPAADLADETPPGPARQAIVEETPDADADVPEPAEPKARALSADEPVAFRDHGVTAEYVGSIAALGYDRAKPDDILALKIHGVTSEDIAEMNRIFGRRPLDEHVSFKIHGVTPEAVRRLSALGLGKLSPDDALSMKIHGVDAAYVEALRAAGYRKASAEEAISARIHGVEPGDVEAWSRLGYANASLDDLVGARIHGASPEFASEVRSLGFSSLPLEDLVSFRIHGVTPDFLREMKSVGLAPPAFSADDAVAFRVHGVTPEFVREIRSLGYSDASADDLAELRIQGMSVDRIRRDNSRAGRRLPLVEHVERHDRGKETDDEN